MSASSAIVRLRTNTGSSSATNRWLSFRPAFVTCDLLALHSSRILGLLLCSLFGLSSAFAGSLVIGSWNLEVLSEVPWLEAQSGVGVSRNRSDLAAIARFLDARRPDVVLLQELAGPRTANTVFGEVEYEWFGIGGGLSETNGNTAELRNSIGVRKNAAISVRRVTAVPGTAFEYEGGKTRAALAAEVETGGTVLTIVNVHLKAGCVTPISAAAFQSSTNKVCVTLRKQVDALARWLRSKAAKGEILLVAGDFNRYLQAEFGVVAGAKAGMRDAVLEALVPRPLVPSLLPAFSRTNCATRVADNAKTGFLDYFLLLAPARSAAISSFAEFPYPESERISGIVYSNHCYVAITLTTKLSPPARE